MQRCFAAVLVILGLGAAFASTASASGAVIAAGTVVTADGVPLSGARINAFFQAGGSANSAVTDTDGTYSFGVAAGHYAMQIYTPPQPNGDPVPELQLYASDVDITNPRNDTSVIPQSTLTVHVTDTNGTALANAHPNVYGNRQIDPLPLFGTSASGVENSRFLGTTDTNGNITIPWLPTLNPVTITVAPPPDSNTVTGTITVPAHISDTTITAVLQPPVIVAGTVVTADGVPLSGARINAFFQAGGSANSAVTDTDGTYSFGVAAGHYAMQIYTPPQPNGDPVPELQLYASDVDITNPRNDTSVIPQSTLTVHVTDTNGTALANAHPNVYGNRQIDPLPLFGTSASGVENSRFLGTTDTNGNITIPWLPTLNPVTITVAPPPDSNTVTGTITVPAHISDTTITAVLQPPVIVAGTVVTADGVPLSGARINAFFQAGGSANSAVTDTDGTYSFGVAAGHYAMQIYTPPQPNGDPVPELQLYASDVDITNPRNDTSVIPQSTLTVHVTDTNGTALANAHPNVYGNRQIDPLPLFGTSASGVENSRFLGTTDTNGNITIPWLPTLNPVTITVAPPPDSNTVTGTITVPAHISDTTITAALSSFEGDLTDAGGDPLPEQGVTLTDQGTTNEVASTMTDVDGSFGVTTDPGIYDVSLEGDVGDPTHYVVKAPKVDLRKPKGEQHLVLPTRDINLHVVDPSGNQVPSAAITMACTSTSFPLLGKTAKGTQCATETADANGNAVLTVLPTATVKITVAPPAGSFLKPTTTTFSPTVGLAKTITLPSLPKPTISVTPSTAGPYVTGQKITYTVTATPPTGGATPAGSVTFAVDGTIIATKTLRTGTATVAVTLPGAGTHTVTGRYSGSSPTYAPASTSSTLKIGKAATTTAFTVNPTAPTAGQPVTVTATVTPTAPASGTPTGQATFTVDGVVQPTATLTAGRATLTLTGLGVGNHTLAVTYLGTDDYAKSTAATTITVTAAATRTTVTSNHPTSTAGQKVTFRIVVASLNTNAGTPTGTVVVTIDGVDQPALTLTDGSATLTTAGLTTGTHQISTRYTADATHAPSTSTALTQTVT